MSVDAVIGMVSAGLGFSVVAKPRQQILDAYAVRLIRLDRQMPKRPIVLARRAADRGNRRIDALLTCIRESNAATAAG